MQYLEGVKMAEDGELTQPNACTVLEFWWRHIEAEWQQELNQACVAFVQQCKQEQRARRILQRLRGGRRARRQA